MTLILLEALGAGLLLVLIVWWTMFSGRDSGEPRSDDPVDTTLPPRGSPDVGTTTPAATSDSASDKK